MDYKTVSVKTYFQLHNGAEFPFSIYQKTLDFIQSEDLPLHIVDLGCGVGHFIMHSNIQPDQYLGIDYHEEFLEFCREHHTHFKFKHEDFKEAKPFCAKTLIVMWNTWGVLPSNSKKHVLRLLGPDSHLVITLFKYDKERMKRFYHCADGDIKRKSYIKGTYCSRWWDLNSIAQAFPNAHVLDYDPYYLVHVKGEQMDISNEAILDDFELKTPSFKGSSNKFYYKIPACYSNPPTIIQKYGYLRHMCEDSSSSYELMAAIHLREACQKVKNYFTLPQDFILYFIKKESYRYPEFTWMIKQSLGWSWVLLAVNPHDVIYDLKNYFPVNSTTHINNYQESLHRFNSEANYIADECWVELRKLEENASICMIAGQIVRDRAFDIVNLLLASTAIFISLFYSNH